MSHILGLGVRVIVGVTGSYTPWDARSGVDRRLFVSSRVCVSNNQDIYHPHIYALSYHPPTFSCECDLLLQFALPTASNGHRRSHHAQHRAGRIGRRPGHATTTGPSPSRRGSRRSRPPTPPSDPGDGGEQECQNVRSEEDALIRDNSEAPSTPPIPSPPGFKLESLRRSSKTHMPPPPPLARKDRVPPGRIMSGYTDRDRGSSANRGVITVFGD